MHIPSCSLSLSLNENAGVGFRMIVHQNAGEEMNWTVLHYYIMFTPLSPLVFIFFGRCFVYLCVVKDIPRKGF